MTTGGNGPVMRFPGIRPEGGLVHGAAASSSSIASTNRTPMTWPLRAALRAIASAVLGSMRGTEARNAHWSAWDTRRSSTKTLLPCCRGSCWSGSAMRLPKPPRGIVSWFGNRRSYESMDSSCRRCIVSVTR